MHFKVQNAIQTTRADDKEIEGEFYKISDIKENEPIFGELQTTGIGFRSIDPEQHVLWPTGRGLYVNCARTQSILINEEEHLRFISKEMNGDFGMYSNSFDFAHDDFNSLENSPYLQVWCIRIWLSWLKSLALGLILNGTINLVG